EMLSDANKDLRSRTSHKEDGASGTFGSPMDIFDMHFGGRRKMPRERRGTGMQGIHQLGSGMVQYIQSVYMECQGHGEWISPKNGCKSCNGRKMVLEKILDVHMNKGMKDDQKIAFH
ncbi:DnaJ subfamily A member 1, partial [Galemys pyrenaicus]